MIGKLITFLKEVRVELKKVNWLSWPQTVRYTLLVLGASLVAAIFLGAVDFGMSILLEKFVL